MPTYQYLCTRTKKRFERILCVADHVSEIPCKCGSMASQVITAPMVIIPSHMSATGVSAYRSPIDGRLITTQAQRREDLARNDCIEYEPGMRQDVDRRVMEDERSLDKSVDETIDRELATMPAHKLERLDAEMTAGLSAEIARY